MRYSGKFSCIFLITVIILLKVSDYTLLAQLPSLPGSFQENIISKLEELAGQYDELPDMSDILDDLYYFLDNPLNLNYASFDDLRRLFFLNDLQIHKIIEYRNVHGNLLSLYELLAIDGFNREIVEMLEPFVTVSPIPPAVSFKPRDILQHGRNILFLRYARIIQSQAGYARVSDSVRYAFPTRYYLGNPDRYYVRYGFNYFERFRAGIIAEKDPGEQFFRGTQRQGFDFYSAHIAFRDLGAIHSLVIGDYQLEFAQGLTMWTGFSFGKSPDIITVKKQARNLRPSTTSHESRFLRGIATTLKLQQWRIIGFYSSKPLDATPGYSDTLLKLPDFVTSIDESGYHRTPRELEKKNINHETLYGLRLHYRNNSFRAGISAFRTYYRLPLITADRPYNKFDFDGNENTNLGGDLNFLAGRFHFFTEAAMSQNGGKALIGGFQALLHPMMSFTTLYRNYGKKYQNFYSNAFGEYSHNQNEQGIYMGVLIDPHKYWTIRAMADFFSSPWLRYRTDFPSYGKEYLIQLEYHPSRRFQMYFRYRHKLKPINDLQENVLPRRGEALKTSFRWGADYQVFEQITLKNRLELLHHQRPDKTMHQGFLIFQDISWQPPVKSLQLVIRYALFDTDGYDERIYTWENDLLYVFSIPAYYYQGSRFYTLLRYSLGKHTDLWIKYSQFLYFNRNTIGSGPAQIEGSLRSEIKAQVSFRW